MNGDKMRKRIILLLPYILLALLGIKLGQAWRLAEGTDAMFDRLGRKDDKTPFVVEWFVNQGIEVWSAKEGQRIFDTHVDKLLNYIMFWQASAESFPPGKWLPRPRR